MTAASDGGQQVIHFEAQGRGKLGQILAAIVVVNQFEEAANTADARVRNHGVARRPGLLGSGRWQIADGCLSDWSHHRVDR